ncbi:hypothetical protein GQ607_016485 [Colletotrichum asianum]|uniref:Uncharacterized protein n=1 Tax=Colletotrichum asianum TaxID=702518 RepID=A0A8H3W0X6_9PEZI|nr:hypothetical protein GQ607_016485 [Colletotrichum asianum]
MLVVTKEDKVSEGPSISPFILEV